MGATGVIRESLALIASRLLGLLLSTLSSLILVRRLERVEYAAYQLVSKRLYHPFIMVVNTLGFWAYRDAARGRREAIGTYLALVYASSAAALLSGAPIIEALTGVSELDSLLLAVCLASLVASAGEVYIAKAVDAHAVARSSVARSLTISGVILAAYLAGRVELWVAAVACILGSLVQIAILAVTVGGPGAPDARLLREWLRGSWVSTASTVAGLIQSLDAPLVAAIAGGEYVAVFFASTLIPRLALDLLMWSMDRLHAFILSTGDVKSAFRAYRLAASLYILATVYTATHPMQAIAYAGSRYLEWWWAAATLATPMVVYAYALILVFYMLGVDESRAAAPGRLVKATAFTALTANVMYVALLAALLVAGLDPIHAWAAAMLAQLATLVALRVSILDRERRKAIAGLYLHLTLYVTLAFIASVLTPDKHSTRIIENVEATLSNLAVAAPLYYAAIAAVDAEFRGVLATAARRLLHSGRVARSARRDALVA